MKHIFKRNSTVQEKINSLLENTKPVGDCLEWTRCLNTDGYPRMSGNVKVHRLMYELNNPDDDIKGFVIRHTCDNPKCINPDHLLKGTAAQNILDRDSRGRTYRKYTLDIHSKVRALLKTGLLTQKEIANIVGIDPRRVSDINTNRYNDEGKIIRR